MTERTEHKRKKVYNVDPLKTKKDIHDFRDILREAPTATGRSNIYDRDVVLFDFGINTGLRVSDIVKLKVNQVQNKDRFIIREEKTGKARTVFIKNLRKELTKYIKELGLKPNEWLFPSRKHGYHISTTQVYRMLVDAGNKMHPKRKDIGTHTMRKTFGYWYYKKTGDIATLMHIFNHSSEAITKRYIGIEQQDIEKSLEDFHI